MTISLRFKMAALLSAASFAATPLPVAANPDPATPSVAEALENARSLIDAARKFTPVMAGEGPYSFVVHALYRLEDEGFDLEDPATYRQLGVPRAEINALMVTNLAGMADQTLSFVFAGKPPSAELIEGTIRNADRHIQRALEISGCAPAPETCDPALRAVMERKDALLRNMQP